MRVKKSGATISLALLVILAVIVGGCCPPYCPEPEEPRDEKYSLSPPTVNAPLYECATAVTVQGFVPGAAIDIYADGSTHIGGGVSDAPWGQSFHVSPDLTAGQLITATQTVNGVTSQPSDPVEVVDFFKTHPEGLPKPNLETPLYECGGAIGVRNLAEGGLLEVFADSSKVGQAAGCGAGQWLFVNPPFVKDQKVHAVETLCQTKGPKSDEALVQSTPASLPPPVVGDVYEGGTRVTVHNITNGAMVKVFNGAQQVAGHYCSGGGQIFGLNPAPGAGDTLTATQELCSTHSDPSDPVTVKPCSELPAPVVAPICAGDDFITVSGTALDARIRVYADGALVGDGGGTRINLVAPLTGNETVTVTQSLGTCVSPSSSPVRVTEGEIKQGSMLTMKNGHTFFKAESGETSIDALVYTRGTGCAPYFMVKTGDAESVIIEITDSRGRTAKVIHLAQESGYWEGAWHWDSPLWEHIPDEIPVGEYKATLKIDGMTKESMKFFVIFSPSEVSAPAEFGLSSKGETGIWFGPGWGSDRALTYDLHPDDKRVFSTAIKTINGENESYKSAKMLHDWVHNHFAYDLSYHTNDVIDLIENHSSAQCADEANMLTALLRAVGIPAHPATADAAVEHGGYNWNFDTWTEAKLKGAAAAEQWYILHPHEYPAMQPESRGTFGASRGVATKTADDVVIMAGHDWVPSEVSDGSYDVKFGYDTPCKEPNQNFDYIAGWLDHLCQQGYWSAGHWKCSPPRESAVMIALDRETYRVGDTIRLDITVNNIFDGPLRDHIEISLIDDDYTSKKWPDTVLEKFTESINVPPGESYKISKTFRLPPGLFADHEYAVEAKLPGMEKYYTLRPFKVLPLFSWEISMPKSARTKEKFVSTLELVNESGIDLTNVRAGLKIPRNISGRLVSKSPVSLPSGGKYAFKWELEALSPSAVSQFIFNVTSDNGGAVNIYQGVQIESPMGEVK